MPETSTYFAHGANAHGANAHGHWHPLAEYLRSVGETAARLAQGWAWADEARLAGFLHDLGKYGDLFQKRLHGQASGLDHWSIGSLEAYLTHKAIGAALAIEGHHIGLQSAASVDFANRLKQTESKHSTPTFSPRRTG